MSGFKGPSYPVFARPASIDVNPMRAGGAGFADGPYPIGDTAGIQFSLDGTDVTAWGTSFTLQLVWSAQNWSLPLNAASILDSATGIATYHLTGGATTLLYDFQSHRGPFLYILHDSPAMTGPLWRFQATFLTQPVAQDFPPVGQWNNTPVVVGGAAAAVTWRVPTGQVWEILSVFATLTSSGTAGNREVQCQVTNENLAGLAVLTVGHTQAATQVADYGFYSGLGSLVIPTLTAHYGAPFPLRPAVLYPDWRIIIGAEGAKAGDAFTNYMLSYRIASTQTTRGLV